MGLRFPRTTAPELGFPLAIGIELYQCTWQADIIK